MSIVFNGVSDSWTDCCYYIDNKFINALSSTFNHLFHFDCFIIAEFLTLIFFPIFFKIYAFGLQHRLRLFYDNSRLIFINFMILCSFSIAITTLMHLLVHQAPPCVMWNGKDIKPFRESSKIPHEGLMLATILVGFAITIDIESKIICIVLSLLISFLYIIALLLNGDASFFQIIISILVGTWIFSLHRFNPPILKLIISFAVAILTIVFFIITYLKLSWRNSFNHNDFHHSLRASFSLIVSNLLLLHFSKQRKHFRWLKTDWALNKHTWGSTSSDAIIPSSANDSQKDDFGNLLTYDLIGGAVGFFLYLLGDLIIYQLDRYFYIFV